MRSVSVHPIFVLLYPPNNEQYQAVVSHFSNIKRIIYNWN